MVKSTALRSLDEAFEQRLTIMDEPWTADYRFAESRLSRRDQYAVRHGQRRPSSEVRNKIQQRKPLPENKHECYKYEPVTNKEDTATTTPTRIEHGAKEWKRQHFNDDTLLDCPVGTCIPPTSDSTTVKAQVGKCDQFLPPDQNCSSNNHEWVPAANNGPSPRHRGAIDDVIDDKRPDLKHAEARESSPDHVQNNKRKLTDTSKIVTQTKRIRNIGSKGNDVTQENKSSFKRHHDLSGESHYSGKRQRPQLLNQQSNDDESGDITEEIRVVVDSMTAMLSSLEKPQTHSHQFKRTLVKSARVRH